MSPDSSSAAPVQPNSASTRFYALGSSDQERRRLMAQGALLRDMTAAGFRAAGIVPGMRVLDLGSGVGDVSLLAADLVGPTGSVVGLDRDPANVAWAVRRIEEAGIKNIRFHVTEFADYQDDQPFDAIVGRFILMYLPDPAATLRALSRHLRSGAVVSFFEPDFTVPSRIEPDIPEMRKCEGYLVEILKRSGATIDMGMRLHPTFRDAGFAGTSTLVSHLSGCGVQRQMVEGFVAIMRNLMPRIEELGVATAEDLQLDTLADRLEALAREYDPQWVATRYISGWTRKP